jgi:hypothetical protein
VLFVSERGVTENVGIHDMVAWHSRAAVSGLHQF